MLQRLIQKVLYRLRVLLIKLRFEPARKAFWNYRADDIDQCWGKDNHNYIMERSLLEKTRPGQILEVGCGSGRLFPLYQEFGITEIVAQDIAQKAIELCKKNHPDQKITYSTQKVTKLKYPKDYFDLVICNRSLSAVRPKEIAETISYLATVSKLVYINEYSQSDYTGQTAYWFLHDYDSLFSQAQCKLIDSGLHEKKTWKLFKSSDN